MASGLMAEQRLAAARDGNLDPLNISFIKTLESMKSLWMILAAAGSLLDDHTAQAIFNRVRESIVRQATPPRRKRNCPRKVRQPASGSQITDIRSDLPPRDGFSRCRPRACGM